jgi:hypothetical protein
MLADSHLRSLCLYQGPTAPLGRLALELYRKCSGGMVLRKWREREAGAVSIEPLAVSRWRSRQSMGSQL